MADNELLERRREIRRRKILENSELRLIKITGRLKNSSSAPDASLADSASLIDCPPSQNSESNAQKTVSDSSGGSPRDSQPSAFPRTYSDGIHYRTRTANERKLDEYVSNSVFLEKETSIYHEYPSVNGTVRQSASEPYAFPKKVSDAETRSYNRSRADSRRNSTCAQIMRESLQLSSLKCSTFRPWIVFTVAGFLRICLLYSNLMFIPENLILPFLLLETLLYIWTRLETQVPSRPATLALVPGLLMLCGVPSSIVNAFTEVYSSLYAIGQDFAVYLFSFVLLHIICENFY